ncbi:HSPB1-associated protein 1 homolog isoform X3 [Clinocottus analis]|uniref:HSPB1-associated protein 1 homolog isoform X3 n=1 Tax=Clinocottus analis TaxID=304258 RepID=UPI0035C1E422
MVRSRACMRRPEERSTFLPSHRTSEPQNLMAAFSPQEARRVLHHLQAPAVFTNMAAGWPALFWTAEHLSDCLGDRRVRFRLGRKEEADTPQFETQCSYVEARLQDFLSWTRGRPGPHEGPFSRFPSSQYWAYADYKYIALLLQDQPSMFQDVKWSDFGFAGRGGEESTLWVGSAGANTPCHLDAYGCNLVLQVQGRKRWHLFPPEDSRALYPTRIPYEESSVFSRVHVVRPDLTRFPAFRGSRAHVVTLQPGQVLYVPQHWWHYVESVDAVTVSVNTWIELEEDDVARLGEAVTKAVICALKADDHPDAWLNPTEAGVPSHQDNMHSVNLALRACSTASTRHRRDQEDQRVQEDQGVQRNQRVQEDQGVQRNQEDQGDARPAKRDSTGRIKERGGASGSFRVPFGPHLVPVRCRASTETSTDPEVKEAAPGGGGEEEGGGNLPRHRAPGPREEPGNAPVTTDDLLDCLLHPDVIARVTELLLARQTGSDRS